jgi:hypothetical protein
MGVVALKAIWSSPKAKNRMARGVLPRSYATF